MPCQAVLMPGSSCTQPGREQMATSQSTPFCYLSPNTALEFSSINCLMEQITLRYTWQPTKTAVEVGTFRKGIGVDRQTWKHLKLQQNDEQEMGQAESLLNEFSKWWLPACVTKMKCWGFWLLWDFWFVLRVFYYYFLSMFSLITAASLNRPICHDF